MAKSLSFLRRKIAAPALIMMPKMLRMKVTTIVAFQPPLSTRPWIWGEEARYCMASLIKTISTFLFSLATLMSMWKFISKAENETMEAHLAAFLLSAYASWREKGWKTTRPHGLKITKNVAFEVLNFGIFHQFLSYQNWPVW